MKLPVINCFTLVSGNLGVRKLHFYILISCLVIVLWEFCLLLSVALSGS